MRERVETKSTALRITNQYRSTGGMAYDLRCEGVRLTLLITERARTDDPNEWRIEAQGALTADCKAVVVEWGTSREDALRALGRAWTSSADTMALRVFDWDAVADALRTVRAL